MARLYFKQFMLNRILTLLKRRSNAKEFGIKFERDINFNMPETVKIQGKVIHLAFPKEDFYGLKLIVREIFLDDDYQLKKLPKNTSTFLDLGANMGFFGLAVKHYFPGAQVHAYEPNPYVGQFTAKQASSGNYKFFPEAVGPKEGKINMDVPKNEKGEQITGLGQARITESGSIPMIPFSKAIERLGGTVDYAKIDIEGGEWSLFQDTTSWQKVRQICMEYHLWEGKGHTIPELETIVKNLGFREIQIEKYTEDTGILTARRG